MLKQSLSPVRPLVLVFIFTTTLFISAKHLLAKYEIDQEVAILGNLILFAVSVGAFFLAARALRSSNPQSFVRATYGSFMVKFFVVIIAAFAYIMMAKKNVSKPALGVCAILYIVYTILETKALTRILKQKKNA